MVASLELLFDERTDAALRRCWADLARAGLPSQGDVRAETNRPHVTVAVATRIDAAIDDELDAVLGQLPIDVVVGAPICFGARRWVLARQIVPSPTLLALHAAVQRAAAPHLIPAAAAHTTVGEWTPHVTLGRRFEAAEVGRALAAVPALSRDLIGRVVALRRWDGDQRVEYLLGSAGA